jgi:hypothetical protein
MHGLCTISRKRPQFDPTLTAPLHGSDPSLPFGCASLTASGRSLVLLVPRRLATGARRRAGGFAAKPQPPSPSASIWLATEGDSALPIAALVSSATNAVGTHLVGQQCIDANSMSQSAVPRSLLALDAAIVAHCAY